MAQTADNSKRNIIFFGETGSGKSSTINLLKGDNCACVSNDARPCTQNSACYQATLNGRVYTLWDTRGLGEVRSFFRFFFTLGGGSEGDLKKFLKERHQKQEIDLIVYCVRGSRATKGLVKYYDTFCAITRQLVAPVVIVVTHLERVEDMEGWWKENSSKLKQLKMEFDGHACITTLPQHPRLVESREKLIHLITGDHSWKARRGGNYFGSTVQKPVPPVSSRPKGPGILRPKYEGTADDRDLDSRPRNDSGNSTAASSTRDSSFQTAESHAGSVPPSPIIIPPSPRSANVSAKVPHNNTSYPRVGDRPQSSSEDTSSMGSSLHSMPCTSSHSSYSSYSDVPLQPCIEENGDHWRELPFKRPTATVRRRMNYASRCGGFADVWECELISEESSRMVAVKAVKACQGDLMSHQKKLRRELSVWGRLQHRNIVPLLGVVSDFGPLPSMVSPWFSNGSLSSYLAAHPTLRLPEKHRMLGDIAAGLCYLHKQDVVHGDLHSDNILIDDDGTACLTDFGLSLAADFIGTSYLRSSICGVTHFADPALVKRNGLQSLSYPTMPCDVYSFGGLTLHVLSGRKPYDGIHTTSLLMTLLKGERPQIPAHDSHITPWHQKVIERCWDLEERKRPSADHLAKMFDR